MRLALTALAVVASGCMASAPPPAPRPAPPPASVEVEAPPVRVIAVEPTVPEPRPVVPPPTPTRRIAQRSVYEQDRVAVYTLENGLTVVYAWDADAAEYASRVSHVGPTAPSASGLVVGSARSAVEGSGPRLDDVLDGVAQTVARVGASGTRVFVSGALEPEWVEPAVADVLGNVAAGRQLAAPVGETAGVDVDWAELPALVVAAALAAERTPGASVLYDPATGRASARGTSASTLAPASDAQARQARGSLSDGSAADLLLALDALFQLPGRYTPARPVSDARAVRDRVARVPPGQVNDLLARLSRTAQ